MFGIKPHGHGPKSRIGIAPLLSLSDVTSTSSACFIKIFFNPACHRTFFFPGTIIPPADETVKNRFRSSYSDPPPLDTIV